VTEIGLFPLDIVLLPGERIPLHIFEERYKELIGECLDANRPFGLILADEEGMRRVGTLATVIDVLERFDDGRMNVVVRGGARFTVAGPTEGRSFATAEVEDFVDAPDAGDPTRQETAACLRAYRELVEAVGADLDERDLTADSLAFELAGQIAFEADAKQALLELRSEGARVRMLIDMLNRAIEQVRRRKEIRERAARNGHVES
jgi:Lon protease-like protein